MTAKRITWRIGKERWRLQHISYSAWCDLARQRGWSGEDGNDGLRDYCEPEDAALVKHYPSLNIAIAAAMNIFQQSPDDSAFGAILVDYQTLQPAQDDQGKLVRRCPPDWITEKVYEITSDGDVLECAA